MSYRRGITLLELVATLTIMSVVAGVIAPVIASASDAYATSARDRRATERLVFTTERLLRRTREMTVTPGAGLDLAVATASRIETTSGDGFRIDGTDLVELTGGADAGIVCADVELFEIRYLGADGVTSTQATPELTRVIEYRIGSSGLRSVIRCFPRSWVGN